MPAVLVALEVTKRSFDCHRSLVSKVSSELVRYWQGVEDLFKAPPQFHSLCSDKSRVLSQSLLSTVLVTPTTVAAWAFPIVRLVQKRPLGGRAPARHVDHAKRGGRRTLRVQGLGIPARNRLSNIACVKYGVHVFFGVFQCLTPSGRWRTPYMTLFRGGARQECQGLPSGRAGNIVKYGVRGGVVSG